MPPEGLLYVPVFFVNPQPETVLSVGTTMASIKAFNALP
jgi:hypothetical protein